MVVCVVRFLEEEVMFLSRVRYLKAGCLQLPGLPVTSAKRGAIASNAYARRLNGLETGSCMKL